MFLHSRKFKPSVAILVILCVICLAVPEFTLASSWSGIQARPPQNIENTIEEKPSPFYDSILYTEIEPLLRQIEKTSKRVKVDVIGQSAGGHDLFLVTLSSPDTMGRLGRYMALRNLMLKDPEKALEMIEQFGDFKVPIFINASIHGNEYPGVDAAIRLIQTLAYDDSPEVQLILENVILLVNVVQNPDGRILGTRANANGFDVNRDFITQSQPETRATVKVLTEWNPMVVLDLHGFVDPMLIEPCTPLHNPNYEYDLYIQWAYYEAEAMEAELLANTGFDAQIPFRDSALGWDDWPPTYTPMYAMYHGAYGHTLETPYQDERGVDAHFWAVWGALKFASQHREAMVTDQIEIFRRGFLALPQMLIPDELLAETQFDQYNELTIQEFPAAYIIPSSKPLQSSPHQASRLINFLLYNDVQVTQSVSEFTVNSTTYPAGTFIVWMNQPKRGLANTILESGRDLSYLEGISFYSPPSVWSNPLLWGIRRDILMEEIVIPTIDILRPTDQTGLVEPGIAAGYLFLPDSLEAFQAANYLLGRDEAVYRAASTIEDLGRSFPAGSMLIPSDSALVSELATRFQLSLFALQQWPADLVQLNKPKIALYADEGTRHALKTMGFEVTEFTTSDLNSARILDYDLFINLSGSWSRLGQPGKSAFTQFFSAGGDYLGLRTNGVNFAIGAGILDASTQSASGNAIVSLIMNPNDPLAAGFLSEDSAFVYSPVWFTALGPDVQVTAWLAQDDFLISGYWPGWRESEATGQPIIVNQSSGDQDTSVLGIDATFRGHPENAFRLLGNAIFASQE